MNKLNFDSLKKIEVPEAWVQNALKIPTKQERKKQIRLFQARRVITLAACLVLIGIISVPLYVFESYETSIPVATQLQTEPNKHNNSSVYQNSQPFYSSESTDPTEEITEISDYTDKTDPTETPTQSYTDFVEPTKATDSREENPTQSFTEATTVPTQPEPTKPEPTKPIPTTPTNPMPTQPSTGAYVQMVPSCTGTYVPDGMTTDTVSMVYCRLYDNFGNPVGDPNLYSSEHIARETETSKGYCLLFYDPTEKGLKLKEGRYRFCFYTDCGDVIFEGNITVF